MFVSGIVFFVIHLKMYGGYFAPPCISVLQVVELLPDKLNCEYRHINSILRKCFAR